MKESLEIPFQTGLYLCLLLLSSINNGCAADFCQFTALSVKGPAADLVSNDIFNEEYTTTVAQGQLLKQLDILEQVVIRVAFEEDKTNQKDKY